MTTQPQVPGAPAVMLFREEISDDNLSMHSVYMRIKVLTEAGKSYADVELPSESTFNAEDIAGRTIQPDGTVVPFAGKPYVKTITRGRNVKLEAKVFTMPAVEVGSIIEYRFTWRYRRLYAPFWNVQERLYLRKGHFVWNPYETTVGHWVIGADGKPANNIAWASNLPPGAKVQTITVHSQGKQSNYQLTDSTEFELNVADIMPLVEEEDAPPVSSLSQRVAFYYTGATSQAEFWKNSGALWSKKINSFASGSHGVKEEAARVTAGADTPDAKLRRIYADVMSLENTDFTRSKDKQEAKPAKDAGDVLAEKGGSSEQLTLLFIALARAAGLHADAAVVANREYRIFWPALFDFRQLSETLVIAQVDGKDVFLDPGERYCPYGLVAWPHTGTQGLRQTGDGSEMVAIPSNPYAKSQALHVADLTMSPDGKVSGTVKITYIGLWAISWRQRYLRGDKTALEHDLKDHFERLLPKGLRVETDSVQNADDYEQPLIATYKVEGEIGESTATRLIVPAQFFETNETPRFTDVKRTLPVYLHYGSREQDAIRIALPANMHWEAQPKAQEASIKGAQYKTSSELDGNALTIRRTLDVGQLIYRPEEYSELHDFFAKVAAGDGEQGVIAVQKDAVAAPASHGQ